MKIVFFDYWTKGIQNFIPLNKRFISCGYETMLLHIGSFNEPKYLKEEQIEGILCRDISYYGTKFIFNALRKIRPDIIISLNTTYIMDRAMVLACRKLGIKTIFMMHGDRSTGKEIDIAINNKPFSFLEKLRKSGKYFFIVLPNYSLSSWKENKLNILTFKPIKVLWLTFNNPSRCNYFPPHSEEVLHDKCLIYANKYIEYYTKLGYDKGKIIVVGNPKSDLLFHLIEKGFPIDLLKSRKAKDLINSGIKYGLYLEDSFQELGMAGWTYQYLGEHLSDISDRLKEENIVLVVKLHPTTDINKIPLINKEIIFIESDLEHLIYYSAFCIGHLSSTVNLAILMNKPVLIPAWGKSKYLPDYYVKHKVANYWAKIEDKLNLTIDETATLNYIKENITITQPVSIDLIENEIYSF